VSARMRRKIASNSLQVRECVAVRGVETIIMKGKEN